MNCDCEILLIEDDLIDRKSLKRAVEKINASNKVIIAENGEEALNYLKEAQDNIPCLILLDLKMPKMNGTEFLIEFNKIYQNKDTAPYLVVLTSSDNKHDLEKCFKLGVGAYLQKPIENAKLEEILSSIKKQEKP